MLRAPVKCTVVYVVVYESAERALTQCVHGTMWPPLLDFEHVTTAKGRVGGAELGSFLCYSNPFIEKAAHVGPSIVPIEGPQKSSNPGMLAVDRSQKHRTRPTPFLAHKIRAKLCHTVRRAVRSLVLRVARPRYAFASC